MPDLRRQEFLKTWFPSIVDHPDPSVFFHSYNAFLCATPLGSRGALHDKVLLAAAMENGGIRTPSTILVINKGRFFSPTFGELSRDNAVEILKGKDAFIKTRYGWGGTGAFRLLANGTIHKGNGTKLDKKLLRLLKKIEGSDYLVQELIKQDERFSAVASSSINTIRCVTFRDHGGNFHIAASTWRMGDGRSVVDNGTSGGIVCCIDPESGKIVGPGRSLDKCSYDVHPSSGFRFDGAKVPDIDLIFETAKAAHRAFAAVASVGWDVAMTPEGPIIIEGNDPWGARGHVLVDTEFERRTWELFMAGREVSGSGFPQGGRARRFEMIKATVSIRGKVQGVGYRNWVTKYSQDRGVAAMPVNLEDGTVSCELTGQRWRVEFVVFACHRGPAAAKVERVDVTKVRRI